MKYLAFILLLACSSKEVKKTECPAGKIMLEGQCHIHGHPIEQGPDGKPADGKWIKSQEKSNCENGAVDPECKVCPEKQSMLKGRCVYDNTGTSVDESKWAPMKGF